MNRTVLTVTILVALLGTCVPIGAADAIFLPPTRADFGAFEAYRHQVVLAGDRLPEFVRASLEFWPSGQARPEKNQLIGLTDVNWFLRVALQLPESRIPATTASAFTLQAGSGYPVYVDVSGSEYRFLENIWAHGGPEAAEAAKLFNSNLWHEMCHSNGEALEAPCYARQLKLLGGWNFRTAWARSFLEQKEAQYKRNLMLEKNAQLRAARRP